MKKYKPRVFVGSSLEGIEIAKAIQMNLEYYAEIRLWTDNVFQLSHHFYESLNKILKKVDYGIFILTPDDFIKHRDQELYAPRDNVIFELGLFCGKIGLTKTFIVHPRNITIRVPSDLSGIQTATYELHSSGSFAASLGPVCTKIRSQMSESPEIKADLAWSDLCVAIIKLSKLLKREPDQGGFAPDVVLGISRGGIIVADLLHRCFGARTPISCLWADRNFDHPKTRFDSPINKINLSIISVLNSPEYRNILLVDDITRTGSTLISAIEFLEKELPGKKIKTAVIVLVEGKDDRFSPDFFVFSTKKQKYKMPFELVC